MNFKTAFLSAAALVAVGSFGYSIVSAGNAQNSGAMDKEAIETIVREYLLDNPEVIIEALDEYSAREALREEALAQESLAQNLPALLNADDGYISGADVATANVAVIELFDYHCGFCKEATGFMNELIDTQDDVAVVFRELPILREESDYAAKIALAARGQGKYREFHTAMMNSKGVLTEERIDRIAKNTGLDLHLLHSAYQAADYEDILLRTREIAIEAGVSGTPSFIVATTDGSYVRFVNGWKKKQLEESIAEAREVAQNPA